MLESKRHAEENVFTTYYLGAKIVGRLFQTSHPTIPFEVFAYKENSSPGIDSKRVHTEVEALEFVEDFLNLSVIRPMPAATAPTSSERGDIPEAAKQLLTQLRAREENSYRLHWTGSKIPRGAKIDGQAISWTQHGVVYVEDGSTKGYYTRLEEWSGEGKDEHEMLISTEYVVEPGPGQTCELVRDFPVSIPTV